MRSSFRCDWSFATSSCSSASSSSETAGLFRQMVAKGAEPPSVFSTNDRTTPRITWPRAPREKY